MATGVVPDPQRPGDMIQQGLGQASQAFSAYQHQKVQDRQLADMDAQRAEQNSPITADQHALMQEMIARIRGGEDPVALGREARQHPVMAPLFGGGQAQPQPQVGPQMSLGGPQAPGQAQPAPQQAAPPPAQPQSAPAQSLGALGGMARMAPPLDASLEGAPQGVGALGSTPMPPPSQAQSASIAPEMAPNGPQNGPQQGGQMGVKPDRFAGFGANTNQRQYAQIMPILQAMATQEGRVEMAKMLADTRAQNAELAAKTQMLIAQLNEQGRATRGEKASEDKAEGRKTTEKVAGLRADTAVKTTGMRGQTAREVADKYVAGGITRTAMTGQTQRDNTATRVGGNKLTPEQQILSKQAHDAELAAAALERVGELDRGPNYAADLKAAREKAATLSAQARATIPQKAGGAIPQATIEDPSHPQAAAATLRVTRNSDGAAILIPPAQFDPAKYTKR